MKNILVLVLVLLLAVMMVACDKNNQENNTLTNNGVANNTTQGTTESTTQENTDATNDVATEENTDASTEVTEQPEYEFVAIDTTQLNDINRPSVTITLEDEQKIVLKLVPEAAPNTVNAFLTLATEGYYNGLIFHRVIPGFMIQGGDPLGTGTGGPGYTLKDEFYTINDLTVTYLSHLRGVLSMAKTSAPNSAGSQFFIMHEDGTFLDGQYSAFGYVVEGIEVVDAVTQIDIAEGDRPVNDVRIKSVDVDLNGYTITAPEIIQ